MLSIIKDVSVLILAISASFLILEVIGYRTRTPSNTNTECIKGARYVIVDDKKIRLKKFDKNALNQVSDIYCVD
jgi:hypothetical protein